ncbi:MAG: DUF2807 domain-containing protein [Weeksellaceae bacterium]
MKRMIITLMMTNFFFSCRSNIEGEGVATAQSEYQIEQFSNLTVDCNCDVTLIPSELPNVVVESHQNIIDNLEVTSKRKDLIIKEKSGVSNTDLYNINVYVNQDLTKIKLTNHAKLRISGTLKLNDLQIELKDLSTISEANVDLKRLEMRMSGLSRIEMKGTAINLMLHASGESEADLFSLQTVDTDFRAEDESQLLLYAMKGLTGTATDNAKVNYKGDPVKKTTERDRAIIEQKFLDNE